ncbi:MAG: TetR/AcrR family transcriptional regulator [Acidimicrobiales bacterium]
MSESTGSQVECEEGSRPLRADAQRNRLRVLEAAEEVFAAQGISVPVDVIAERAGVGVGTLYRHFPTKEKLFEAILVGYIVEIAADARSRLGAADPGAAFFGFLRHLVEESASKRDLMLAMSGAGVEFEVVAAEAKQDLQAAVMDLLQAAQRSGAVRGDVTGEMVLSLVGGTCIASYRPHMESSPLDMLAIICDGLRTPEHPPDRRRGDGGQSSPAT